MTKNTEECIYYHRMCASGCTKVACRSKFPETQPLIMDSMKVTCQHKEHVDCERYKEGLVFQQARRDAKKGCLFLTNNECGHPERFRCNGATPPFIVEKDNFLDSCFGADFKACPNYAAGMAFREEVQRVKADSQD